MHTHIHKDPDEISQFINDLGLTPETDIAILIDARTLKCPMPLLKVKLALREVADGACLYLITNDGNAGTDLGYFCQKNNHAITHFFDDNGQFHAHIYKNTPQNA